MVRGVSGLRSAVALLEVGSPLTMYRMGLAERDHLATPVIYADEWGTAPRRNLHTCRYYRKGKWLLPLSQMAWRLVHWISGPVSATSLTARRKAGSYGLLSLLDRESGNAHAASARKSRKNASGRKSGRRRRSSQMPSCNGRDRVKVR